MAKYRKTALVEAEPYRAGMEDGFVCGPINECCIYVDAYNSCRNCKLNGFSLKKPFIDTLEGPHIITPTDMILTGIKGERWPVKKDIFELTYEKVSE